MPATSGPPALLRRVAGALGVSRRGRTFSVAQRAELQVLGAEVQATRAAAEQALRVVAGCRPVAPEPVAPAAEPAFAPDGYVAAGPDPQALLDLFQGEWASRMPEPYAGLAAGGAALFEDGRITWTLEVLGPVDGRRVLELGPLECGHTWMLDRAGAAEVVAVEGNRRAFLRCLVVKELFGIPSARLLLADFVPYLTALPEHERFDLAFASGVLYHMRDPLQLLELLTAHVDDLVLWTHVYDEERIRSRPELSVKFSGATQVSWRGRQVTYHRQEYQAALTQAGFCGGSAEWSSWLSRQDLFAALDTLGFDIVETAFEHDDHQNGPALALAARRRSG